MQRGSAPRSLAQHFPDAASPPLGTDYSDRVSPDRSFGARAGIRLVCIDVMHVPSHGEIGICAWLARALDGVKQRRACNPGALVFVANSPIVEPGVSNSE